MLIVDDILLAPWRGLFWVFRKIHQSVQENLEGQKQQITSQLSELYMQLDTGKISEEEFDARETQLLDRLDAVKHTLAEAAGPPPGEPGGPPAGEESGRGGVVGEVARELR